jgi:hypothetical protein
MLSTKRGPVSAMNFACPQDPVGHMRGPDIKDLPPDKVLLLQRSLAELELMPQASTDFVFKLSAHSARCVNPRSCWTACARQVCSAPGARR